MECQHRGCRFCCWRCWLNWELLMKGTRWNLTFIWKCITIVHAYEMRGYFVCVVVIQSYSHIIAIIVLILSFRTSSYWINMQIWGLWPEINLCWNLVPQWNGRIYITIQRELWNSTDLCISVDFHFISFSFHFICQIKIHQASYCTIQLNYIDKMIK